MVAAAKASYCDYAEGVVDGRIRACKAIVQACQRFARDLETAGERGLIFDERAAGHAITFIELLKHSKGKWRGRPLMLSAWQRLVIANLFGWRWKATGCRRFKRAYIEIPRKNGKSTLAAAIALYMLVADGEGAPEIYTAATGLEQAKIVFGECKRMVLASRALRARITVYRQQLTIANRDALLMPLHSASQNLDGLNMHCGIVDEYHEHKSSETQDKLRTSTGARDQALIFIITTAGKSIESPCYRERGEGLRVLEQTTVDDALFVFIACIDDGDDWTNEQTWWKCNPNLGVSRSLQNMREDFAEARNSAAKEADFKRYFLDKWTNEESRWLNLDHWRACRTDTLSEDDLAAQTCFAGLDLSSIADLTALVLYFPGLRAVYPRFFMPRENMLERERRDKVPFSRWVREGWILASPGNMTDTDVIRAEARRLGERFKIREIAFDRWNTLTLIPQLQSDGFTMVQFGQGFASMSGPSKEFERLVISRRLWHGGNPVLQWMASNVCVETDGAENIKPSKAASFERIDGIVAAVMAIGRAIVQPEARGSVYEQRGVMTL